MNDDDMVHMVHFILLDRVDKCFRCNERAPHMLIVMPNEHTALCEECMTLDERTAYEAVKKALRGEEN